jgi:hypothetical protein
VSHRPQGSSGPSYFPKMATAWFSQCSGIRVGFGRGLGHFYSILIKEFREANRSYE